MTILQRTAWAPGLRRTVFPVALRTDSQTRTQTSKSAAQSRSRQVRLVIIAGILLLAVAAAISVIAVDKDSGTDAAVVARSSLLHLGSLRWQYAAIVIVLAGAHYIATAIAARAASGLPLPMGETLLVQFAAAAANRLTPAGLGGSAVTARYFMRRGLEAPSAIGAVGALAALGAAADLIVLLALAGLAVGLGLRGSAQQLDTLLHHLSWLADTARSPWFALAVGAVSAAVIGRAFHRRVERRKAADGVTSQAGRDQLWLPIRRLLNNPAAALTLMIASGCTTLVLGIAFVASTLMVPGPRPVGGVLILVIGFMLGAASGSAVPVPAGLGSTEAALVTVLVGLNVPASHAVEQVLIFRLLTFWAPAVVGVLATRRLYRDRAL